jgi:hypothetical protein
MKKVLFSLSAVAMLSFIASTAMATCTFNEPFKAKGLKSDMVSAMTPCGGTSGAAINTASSTGIPGCTPPVALSSYLFGAKGKCSIKSKAKAEAPCKTTDFADPSCSDITLKLSCSDILRSDGTTPVGGVDDDGWSISTLARTTFEDINGAGDEISIIDFPLQFPVPEPAKGKVKAKVSANSLLIGTGGLLPACSAIEILNLVLVDPNGDPFAQMGTSTR